MESAVWAPQERQAAFLKRKEYEALYGGAAGGGKSDALLAEALRQVDKKAYRGLLLRKTYPQCRELIDRSREIYGPAFPGAKYNESLHCWTFPSGAKIYFGAMHRTADRTNYQGRRYDFIAFDELTHFTWDEYSYMFSRNRPGAPGMRCYIRASCNPGGIGHSWVKERFITGKEPMKTYVDEYNVGGRALRRDRVFVPSTVFDNKILLENNPNYLASLAMLPEAERKALLYGDWDSFSGQVFSEFKNNPEGYRSRVGTHVIDPFPIPAHWRRYRSFDFGYTKPFSVAWWAVDTEGVVYRYRELYGCGREPNTGVKWTPQKIAREIKQIEDSQERGNQIIGIADPSIWDKSRGEDVAGQMEKEGVFFSPGKNSRIAGKMQLHYRLSFDGEGRSRMYVFHTCKDFIRTIPALIYDETHVEDIDTDGEDHIYDETRYFLMENPVKSMEIEKKVDHSFDPLDLWRGKR